MAAGILKKFKAVLDLPPHTIDLTLGEGNTPLIPMPHIAKEIGPSTGSTGSPHAGSGQAAFELFVKFEGMNPTGSFKDRGMVAAVAEAAGRGVKSVICASTGNTAAAAAAYAARAGMRAVVVMPAGHVARGKIVASAATGAQLVQVNGNFDDALKIVVALTKAHPIALVNSINPARLQGQQTAAFEIIAELGHAPDLLVIPVGNAGNITSYAMGFERMHSDRQSGAPQFLGVQAAGSAPLVNGTVVEKPETIASAIRIGNPVRGEQATMLVERHGGGFVAVTDEQILAAQDMLARDGIWVEPASAAPLAGLKLQIEAGKLDVSGKSVVIVCTGHGLKDPDIIKVPEIPKIDPDLAALESLVKSD